MKELLLKKCMKCGALVEVLKDCTCDDCGIKCCGEEMKALKPNSVDASQEKHLPKVEIIDSEIIVNVDHVMEDEHYIEWIALVSDNKIGKKYLLPANKAIVTFPYIKGSTVYSYCNKHGLWSTKID